jgi:hypothetical protein
LGVGDKLSVPITVTAGATDLSGVTLSALKLAGNAATVTTQPPGISNFALRAHMSSTFDWQVKGVKAGSVTLTSSVSGKDAAGTIVSSQDSKSLKVASKAIRITITTTPNKHTLKVDDKGKVHSATLQVRVRVANTTKLKITGISVISLDPVPADRTQRLHKLRFAKGELPIKIGTLAPGASKVKTLKLKVTGDGKYVVKALALYADKSQPGGNGRATGQGGAFTVAVPLLFFTASLEDAGPGGQVTVAGGTPWYVSGHVKNLSSYQTVCLSPLTPNWGSNAGGLGPNQIGVVGPGEPAPPLAGPVEPGETISWLLRADTDANGGTRGSVTLKPRVTLGETGDDCNVLSTDRRPALAASKLKIARGSDSFSAHVEVSHANSDAGAGFLEFFGAYGEGSYKVLAKLLEAGTTFVKEYGGVPKLYAALRSVDPVHAAHRAATALASVARATALTASFWINATTDEQDVFLFHVYEDFAAKTGQVWTGTENAIRTSARSWFDGVVRAYYAGDDSAMFKSLGGTAGEGLTQTAIEMAKFELGLTLLKKGAQLTSIAARVVRTGETLTGLRGITVGRLLKFEEMQRLWGLSKADFEAFKQIAEEEGVVIGVRGRSPRSVKNLEEGAVWKHENLKPKNVNDIDYKYLGFPERDADLVAFRTYTPEQKRAILEKIHSSGLNKEQLAAVLDRAETRFGEKQYLSQIEHYAHQGEIDVGFNYADNGLKEESTSELRKFALDGSDIGGGAMYYRPLQENPALKGLAEKGKLPDWCKRLLKTVLCRVTGDMDGVYITNVGGTSLSDTKRLRIYLKLAKAGWQHPETLTWLLGDGQFFFSAKKKILAGLEKAGQAMIEFGPDGKQRATYFDLSKSFLFAPDSYYIDVLGGYGALK